MRALCLTLALALTAPSLPACVEPDLGDEPLLCNAGTPRCPQDYVCIAQKDGREHCVREGSTRATSATRLDGGVAESDGE